MPARKPAPVNMPSFSKVIPSQSTVISSKSTVIPSQSTVIPSPFMTADRLMKEDRQKSENGRRLERWADAMVRERKLDPSWKDDRDAALTARWIADRNASPPPERAKRTTAKKM